MFGRVNTIWTWVKTICCFALINTVQKSQHYLSCFFCLSRPGMLRHFSSSPNTFSAQQAHPHMLSANPALESLILWHVQLPAFQVPKSVPLFPSKNGFAWVCPDSMCIVARERLNKSSEYTSVFAQDMMRFVPICFYSYSLEKTGSYIINSEYTRISPSL